MDLTRAVNGLGKKTDEKGGAVCLGGHQRKIRLRNAFPVQSKKDMDPQSARFSTLGENEQKIKNK
jgi:hypothetical protein